MKHDLRIAPLCLCVATLCMALSAGGCDRVSTPTQPGVPTLAPAPVPVPPPPTGDPLAVLAIKRVVIAGEPANVAPAITLVETGGRADALVTSVTFNLADGPPWPSPLVCVYCSGTRVLAGNEAVISPEIGPYGDWLWSFSVPGNYTGRLTVAVSFRDEDGRQGSVSAAVALPWGTDSPAGSPSGYW